MPRYADEEMYEAPEPMFSHKRRYAGAGPEAPAKKRKSAVKMADRKGSSKTTGVRGTEFRFASVYNSLRAIAEELGGVKTTDKEGNSADATVSWSKSAVLMIASALEYRLKKLLRDANSFTTFTGKKTVSVAAVERAAESNGIPLSVIRGSCQEKADADAVVAQISGREKAAAGQGKAPAVRSAKSKAARTRQINSMAARRTRDCRESDFQSSSDQFPSFHLVSKAVSKASVKSLLNLVGAQRSSTNDIHMVVTNIAHGFLYNVVRNIVTVLKLQKAVRVSEHLAKVILQGVGITSVGFSGISRIEHQKRVKRAAEDVAEVADAMVASGAAPGPVFNPPPIVGMT